MSKQNEKLQIQKKYVSKNNLDMSKKNIISM